MYTTVIRDDFKENVIDMTFMITNKCNYTCTYCIENIPYLKSDEFKWLDLIKTLEFINKYIKTYPTNTINIRIYGGEPTLHPDLPKFCQQLDIIPQINIIEIFTNFSTSYELFNRLLSISKVNLFTSYHTSKLMSDKEYLNKLLKFNKQFYNKIVCNIMLENIEAKTFDDTYKLYKMMIKIQKNTLYNKIRTELIPLFSTQKYNSSYKKCSYNIFEIINNLNNEKVSFTLIDNNNIKTKTTKVVGFNSFNFKTWLCTSGKNAIFVDSVGDVYPCGGLYTKRHDIYHAAIRKNIFQIANINDIFQYTICPHTDCVLCVPMKVENLNKIDVPINDTDIKYNIT